METNATFVVDLRRRVPDLEPIYREHLADNDELLPHVFMGDVTRFTIAQAKAPLNDSIVVSLLECLEEGLREGGEEVKELIVVSFVENLIGETTTLASLGPLIGGNLKEEVERVC